MTELQQPGSQPGSQTVNRFASERRVKTQRKHFPKPALRFENLKKIIT